VSTEALLAILGLLCAVYPLLPEERRRDIQIRLSVVDWILIIGTVVALHVIKFYPLLHQNGLVPSNGPWRYGLDAESASYLLLVTVSLVLMLLIWRRPLAASRLPAFAALVETQLQHGHHGNLAALLGRHWRRLTQFHRPDGTWRARMFQRFDTRPGVRIVVDGEPAIRSGLPVASRFPRARAWMARRFAGAKRSAEQVDEIFMLALRNDAFVGYLASTHLPLALRMLAYPSHERHQFQSRLFEALLADPRSTLYQEIRDNRNLRGGHRYALPARNRLLTHYLADPTVAQEMAVYEPVGNFALHALTERKRLASDAYDLALDGRFQEVDAWRCPVHTAIQFFDIMVLEALHHRVPWHMWLYYFPPLVEHILDNMTRRADVDYDREFPTPYHYLLYQLFSAMGTWVQEAAALSADDPAFGQVSVDLEHDNGSIPKSAILAIGQCLRHVLRASQLTARFKSDAVEWVLRDLKDVQRHHHARALADTLVLSVAHGGLRSTGALGHTLYEGWLLSAIADIDLHLCMDIVDRFPNSALARIINAAHDLGDDAEAQAEFRMDSREN
jgi:hypothetical protein